MADYIRFEIVNCDEVAIWLTHKGQTISRVQFSNDGGKTWEFNCLSTKQPMLKVATPKHQEFITAPVDRLTPDGVLDAVVKARESVGFVSSVAAPTKPTFDDAAFTKDLRLITERLLKEAGLAVSVILSETGKERTLQLTGGTEGKPGWFKTLPVVIRNDLGPLSWEKSIRALINTVKGDILSAQAAEAAKKEIDKMLNTQPKHRPLTQAVVDAAVSNAKKLGGTLQLCVHGSIDTSVMVPSNVLISHFPSSMEPGQWAIVFSNQADSGQTLDSSTWPEGTQSPYEFEQAVKAVAEAEGWKYNLSYSAWPTDGVWVKFTDPDGREYIKTCHSNDGVKEFALSRAAEKMPSGRGTSALASD